MLCHQVSVERSFEGIIIVRNVGKHSPKYTVSHLKTLRKFTFVEFTYKEQQTFISVTALINTAAVVQ
jgi:hypothetical protein